MLLTHSTSYSVNTLPYRSRNHSLNSASKHKLAAEVVVPNKFLDKEELIIETLGELLYILAVMAATQGNNKTPMTRCFRFPMKSRSLAISIVAVVRSRVDSVSSERYNTV